MSNLDLDVRALALLVAVAETGSLGAGARKVDIAQPNASRSIRRLERQLGFALLERSTRGSTVTPAGVLVVNWARTVLEATEGFLTAARTLRGDVEAKFAVAVSMTIAEYLFPTWLTRLREQVPTADVTLRVHNSVDVEALVNSGDCAVGFVEAPRVVSSRLNSTLVGTDRLVLVVSPNHPWAKDRSITIEELANTRLVTREAGSGTRATLDEALFDYGGLPDPLIELNSNAAVRVSVSAGAGPTVLSEHAVSPWLRSGELVEVEVPLNLGRELHAVWRKSSPPQGAVRHLVQIARQHGAELKSLPPAPKIVD